MANGVITNPNKASTFTPTVSKTSGNSSFYSAVGARSGNICSLSITFTNGSDTSAGDNSFVGTITNVPRPLFDAVGTGYYVSHLFAAKLEPTGAITVRVVNCDGYWSATDRHGITIMYICA